MTDSILIDHPETTSRKKPKHNDSTYKAFNLMDKGVSPRDAHKLSTGKDNVAPQSISALKKKYNNWLLSKESTVKLASKVYIDTMKMKPVKTKEIKSCPECNGKTIEEGEPDCVTCSGQGVVKTLIYPSHTNRMAAAAAVMDRIDPIVKQNVNLNLNTDVSPVDLTHYLEKNCG